jgi:[ribosomal protein S18]-alanine N-acetyltransferase
VIRLRGVERTDLDALFAIDQECFRPGIAYTRAHLRYYFSHPRSISILAEDDETKAIFGFAIAESYLEEGLPIGHIITIDIRSSNRRHGVGRLLMEAILGQLSAVGAIVVRLEVAVDNVAARAFYRELGFRRTGRIPGYYLGRVDALLMEKQLGP